MRIDIVGTSINAMLDENPVETGANAMGANPVEDRPACARMAAGKLLNGKEIDMKKSIAIVVVSVLLALGTVQSSAQTTFTTNWVQMFAINVSGLYQGPTRTTATGTTLTTTRVLQLTTRQLIVALGQALGVNFSPNARLLVITPQGGGSSTFVVRDIVNRTRVDRDVSSFFAIATVGATVSRTTTTTDGRVSGTEYSIEAFSIGPLPDGTRLDLQGAATASFYNNSPRAQYLGVYGTGTATNGAPAVVSGMISISGPRLESVAQ